jgi:D-alanine-D-alanine ligase
VVEGPDGPVALPAVEIRPDGGVYDYSARYTAGATEFVVPATLSPQLAEACAETAITAHRALGLRDLSRSDLIVDASGTVWFLEVNLAPGMTETSSVPLAVEASGQTLTAVCAGLVRRAASRAVPSGPTVTQ